VRSGRPGSRAVRKTRLYFQDGDFSLVEDYWGFPQVKVNILSLSLLRPDVIAALQVTLADFPEWEIVAAVANHGHFDDWPDMGLLIRQHEIIDGLQRSYFPPQYRSLEYPGSRKGTERD
jgi:hypothetical protein